MSSFGTISLETLQKVKEGKCCVNGCNNHTELVLWDQTRPPILCDFHQRDGTDTHSGIYAYSSAYYNVWTCCQSSYKMSTCWKLLDKFVPYCTEIPITAKHLSGLEDKKRQFEIEDEERRRMEAQYHAGHDEYYDRS